LKNPKSEPKIPIFSHSNFFALRFILSSSSEGVEQGNFFVISRAKTQALGGEESLS
jgi:hypothetical protein